MFNKCVLYIFAYRARSVNATNHIERHFLCLKNHTLRELCKQGCRLNSNKARSISLYHNQLVHKNIHVCFFFTLFRYFIFSLPKNLRHFFYLFRKRKRKIFINCNFFAHADLIPFTTCGSRNK